MTVTYAIPAARGAPGGYRAGKAYADLCAVGNGTDSGALKVVVPDGFDVVFDGGTDLSLSGDAKGVQTYGSGTISAPYNFWTCLEATDTVQPDQHEPDRRESELHHPGLARGLDLGQHASAATSGATSRSWRI